MVKRTAFRQAVWAAAALWCSAASMGQPGAPPALVEVATVTKAMLAPTTDLKGSVYFKEVSSVATEVSGKVTEVLFEEGDRVRAGTPLVRLDYTLLTASLTEAEALYRQGVAQLELERVRLERAETLLRDEVTTPQEFDNIKFTVEALTHRVAANKAQVERLRLEISKKTTAAPYDGVVLERKTELGEWKGSGESLVVLAREGVYDVVANVPERQLPWVTDGAQLDIVINERHFRGAVAAVIPRGDVATRTFPVKLRIETDEGLLEGMSALVSVPSGERVECLQIPRDAVILEGGATFVVVVRDGKAARAPVRVIGYLGTLAGIEANGLAEGAEVATKGHERLREGQPVEVAR